MLHYLISLTLWVRIRERRERSPTCMQHNLDMQVLEVAGGAYGMKTWQRPCTGDFCNMANIEHNGTPARSLRVLHLTLIMVLCTRDFCSNAHPYGCLRTLCSSSLDVLRAILRATLCPLNRATERPDASFSPCCN